MIPRFCKQPGDSHVDPNHSRAAYAGFDPINVVRVPLRLPESGHSSPGFNGVEGHFCDIAIVVLIG